MHRDRYLRALAFELRRRRVEHFVVIDALSQVVRRTDETGRSGEQLFGAPERYAAMFPRGSGLAAGRLVATVTTTASLAGLAAWHVVAVVLHAEPSAVENVAAHALVLGGLVLGTTVGARVDHRIPRQLLDGGPRPVRR